MCACSQLGLESALGLVLGLGLELRLVLGYGWIMTSNICTFLFCPAVLPKFTGVGDGDMAVIYCHLLFVTYCAK